MSFDVNDGYGHIFLSKNGGKLLISFFFEKNKNKTKVNNFLFLTHNCSRCNMRTHVFRNFN